MLATRPVESRKIAGGYRMLLDNLNDPDKIERNPEVYTTVCHGCVQRILQQGTKVVPIQTGLWFGTSSYLPFVPPSANVGGRSLHDRLEFPPQYVP